MPEKFARYDSREIRLQYFNGACYIVRRDLHPFTRSFKPGGTVQGVSYMIGIHQGVTPAYEIGNDGGFKYTRTQTRAL